MFFKRLSRSRSNSQSYVDQYNSPHDSKAHSGQYDDNKYSSDTQQHNTGEAPSNSLAKDPSMYPSHQDSYTSPPVTSPGNRPMGNGGYSGMGSAQSPSTLKPEPMPDLLTRAFNEAVRPYTSRLEELESDIADLKQYVEQLENQRREVHAWIDKRGLRPGKTGLG